MSDLSLRLANHAREKALFPRPGLALLAVSGGGDSLALLDLMSVVAPELGLDLAVAHTDHGIAPESGSVANQVRGAARQYGLPVHVATLALGARATETRARRERYRALRAFQQELGATYLVTAHHADDQVETVLFRFLRGSGPAGLSGIHATGARGLVRPLLPFRRSELELWLDSRFADRAERLVVHHDPANRDRRHDRSWIRSELLPLLEERFSGRAGHNLLLAQRHAERERGAWSVLIRQLRELDFRQTAAGVDVARLPLRTYDKALSHALLRALAREAGCRLGAVRAARLLALCRAGTSGRTVELGEGWTAELVFDRLRIERGSRSGPPVAAGWGTADSGAIKWGGWEINWNTEPAGAASRMGLTTWVKRGPGEVRAVQGGDRLFPLGGSGRRSVRRLLMEARVPRAERSSYPVMVRGSELLWVPGICRGAGELPSPGEEALRIDARHA